MTDPQMLAHLTTEWKQMRPTASNTDIHIPQADGRYPRSMISVKDQQMDAYLLKGLIPTGGIQINMTKEAVKLLKL